MNLEASDSAAAGFLGSSLCAGAPKKVGSSMPSGVPGSPSMLLQNNKSVGSKQEKVLFELLFNKCNNNNSLKLACIYELCWF